MYLVVLYIFIRWKGRVTIIVTITFLRIIAIRFASNQSYHTKLSPSSLDFYTHEISNGDAVTCV